MSRLSIEIDPEQHRQIKTLATFSGMSMKDYILAKVLNQQTDSEVSHETAYLLSSPANAKRLAEAVATPKEEHRVFETLEDLKDALGV